MVRKCVSLEIISILFEDIFLLRDELDCLGVFHMVVSYSGMILWLLFSTNFVISFRPTLNAIVLGNFLA